MKLIQSIKEGEILSPGWLKIDTDRAIILRRKDFENSKDSKAFKETFPESDLQSKEFVESIVEIWLYFTGVVRILGFHKDGVSGEIWQERSKLETKNSNVLNAIFADIIINNKL
jgi:hypothetical protein